MREFSKYVGETVFVRDCSWIVHTSLDFLCMWTKHTSSAIKIRWQTLSLIGLMPIGWKHICMCLFFDCLLHEFRKDQFSTEQHSKFKDITKEVISTKSCYKRKTNDSLKSKLKLAKMCISRTEICCISGLQGKCWPRYISFINRSRETSFQSSTMHFEWIGLRIKPQQRNVE